MQRQSLGSPGRAVLSIHDAVSKSDDSKRRDSSPSGISVAKDDDDEIKPEKPLRCRYHPEKLVHLIPILILLCFFVLYFFSHDPSSRDLAEFHRLKHPEKLIDSTHIDEIGRVIDNKFKGGEIFAIRSLQNLQEEEEETSKPHSHRKLGDFK